MSLIIGLRLLLVNVMVSVFDLTLLVVDLMSVITSFDSQYT